MKIFLTFVLLIFGASPVAAETLQLKYQQFYSHLRKLNGEDTQALQFAFGFLNDTTGRLCKIQQASIVTPKQTLPIEISPEQRFTLPSEKALKLADATIDVELAAHEGHCDMSVQLETRPQYLKSYYSADELSMLVGQYEAFFNEMGSFLSFMMPSVKGLSFQFADPYLQQPLKDAPQITSGLLQLPSNWLQQEKPLVLPEAPIRITAIASAQ
ncbi:DUF2987 domain-containing protein [Salinimonas marina]|uniref:DUF2987 domain-containing protein n=1 Tax=Salinimonas marina TaxID=2785918 RepID=A0A7S9DZW0_9ALTE|nr:DUF2987 domain-containing protein [Salinimonas marina]QPG06999.1 DUF2987 domain-containing protein [Salinimonas marina]